MTYKGMLLGALFVPFTLVGNSDIDAGIQQLKNDLRTKEIELCELGKLIEEKQAWIDSMTKVQHAFYRMVFELADNEEKVAFKQELDDFLAQVDNIDFAKDDIQQFLAKKANNNVKSRIEIQRIKAWYIRYNAEYYLLSNLTNRYEQCLQQFIALGIRLKNLQS